MKLYSCKAIDNLIQQYYNQGGEMIQLEDGGVGYGKFMLHGNGLKTAIITEVYLNEWSSGHKVRFYNKVPAKYSYALN